MERAFLEDCLSRGLSLEAIGELAGKHPSTVGYWVGKHCLQANGAARFAPRGGIDPEVLERLVAEGLSGRKIAERLGLSLSTVRHWLKRYDLATARATANAIGPEDRPQRIERRCTSHGMTEFVREGRGHYRCRRCRADHVMDRRRKVKRLLVQEAGGACVLCGYSRCVRALEFHHVDPLTKEFNIALRGVARSLERARTETKKCVLLCANCHAEVEAGDTVLPVELASACVPR